MAIRLNSADPDFEARFSALLAAKREVAEDVEATARKIVEDVRERGDEALIAYTGNSTASRSQPNACASPRRRSTQPNARSRPKRATRSAIARDRIEAFHRRQLPKDDRYTDALGVELGSRWTPIERSGSTCRAERPPIRARC